MEIELFSLNYFNYKKPYFGSLGNMRFRVWKDKEANTLVAQTWRGPFASDKVAEEDKTTKSFPFDEDGREDLLHWLVEEHADKFA